MRTIQLVAALSQIDKVLGFENSIAIARRSILLFEKVTFSPTLPENNEKAGSNS